MDSSLPHRPRVTFRHSDSTLQLEQIMSSLRLSPASKKMRKPKTQAITKSTVHIKSSIAGVIRTLVLSICILCTCSSNIDIFYIGFVYAQDESELSPNYFSNTHCGIPNRLQSLAPGRRQLILNGELTEQYEYPWVVAIAENSNNQEFCVGVILNEYWVATAAHCLYDFEGNVKQASNVVILAKQHKLHDVEAPLVPLNEARYEVEALHVHPGHDVLFTANDFALIKIKDRSTYAHAYGNLTGFSGGFITGDEKIKPVCLFPYISSSTSDETVFEKEEPMTYINAIVAGWGTTSSGAGAQNAQYLRDVAMITYPRTVCASSMGGEEFVTEDMLCAAGRGNTRDACVRDSGAGLFADTKRAKNSHQYLFVGAVSWGDGCGNLGVYGVYARAGYFLQFIHDKMQNDNGGANPASSKITYMGDSLMASLNVDASGVTLTSGGSGPPITVEKLHKEMCLGEIDEQDVQISTNREVPGGATENCAANCLACGYTPLPLVSGTSSSDSSQNCILCAEGFELDVRDSILCTGECVANSVFSTSFSRSTCQSKYPCVTFLNTRSAPTFAGRDMACSDIDFCVNDSNEHGCHWYEEGHAGQCGDFDNSFFTAATLCCACGGGTTSVVTDAQKVACLEHQPLLYTHPPTSTTTGPPTSTTTTTTILQLSDICPGLEKCVGARCEGFNAHLHSPDEPESAWNAHFKFEKISETGCTITYFPASGEYSANENDVLHIVASVERPVEVKILHIDIEPDERFCDYDCLSFTLDEAYGGYGSTQTLGGPYDLSDLPSSGSGSFAKERPKISVQAATDTYRFAKVGYSGDFGDVSSRNLMEVFPTNGKITWKSDSGTGGRGWKIQLEQKDTTLPTTDGGYTLPGTKTADCCTNWSANCYNNLPTDGLSNWFLAPCGSTKVPQWDIPGEGITAGSEPHCKAHCEGGEDDNPRNSVACQSCCTSPDLIHLIPWNCPSTTTTSTTSTTTTSTTSTSRNFADICPGIASCHDMHSLGVHRNYDLCEKLEVETRLVEQPGNGGTKTVCTLARKPYEKNEHLILKLANELNSVTVKLLEIGIELDTDDPCQYDKLRFFMGSPTSFHRARPWGGPYDFSLLNTTSGYFYASGTPKSSHDYLNYGVPTYCGDFMDVSYANMVEYFPAYSPSVTTNNYVGPGKTLGEGIIEWISDTSTQLSGWKIEIEVIENSSETTYSGPEQKAYANCCTSSSAMLTEGASVFASWSAECYTSPTINNFYLACSYFSHDPSNTCAEFCTNSTSTVTVPPDDPSHARMAASEECARCCNSNTVLTNEIWHCPTSTTTTTTMTETTSTRETTDVVASTQEGATNPGDPGQQIEATTAGTDGGSTAAPGGGDDSNNGGGISSSIDCSKPVSVTAVSGSSGDTQSFTFSGDNWALAFPGDEYKSVVIAPASCARYHLMQVRNQEFVWHGIVKVCKTSNTNEFSGRLEFNTQQGKNQQEHSWQVGDELHSAQCLTHLGFTTTTTTTTENADRQCTPDKGVIVSHNCFQASCANGKYFQFGNDKIAKWKTQFGNNAHPVSLPAWCAVWPIVQFRKFVEIWRGYAQVCRGVEDGGVYHGRRLVGAKNDQWQIGDEIFAADVCAGSGSSSGTSIEETSIDTSTAATGSATSTDSPSCIPYSEPACRTAAEGLGYKLGGSSSETLSFAGNYMTKGCYIYQSGADATWQGAAWFGTGGTLSEMSANFDTSAANSQVRRPAGYDCQINRRRVLGAEVSAPLLRRKTSSLMPLLRSRSATRSQKAKITTSKVEPESYNARTRQLQQEASSSNYESGSSNARTRQLQASSLVKSPTQTYPLSELAHAMTMSTGPVDLDGYEVDLLKEAVTYNVDIFSTGDNDQLLSWGAPSPTSSSLDSAELSSAAIPSSFREKLGAVLTTYGIEAPANLWSESDGSNPSTGPEGMNEDGGAQTGTQSTAGPQGSTSKAAGGNKFSIGSGSGLVFYSYLFWIIFRLGPL